MRLEMIGYWWGNVRGRRMTSDTAELESCSSDDAEVLATMNAWASAFAGGRIETLLALYADDAVLWGTLSPIRRDTPEGIRDYFEPVFRCTNRRAEIRSSRVRIYENTAINTGSYTVSWHGDDGPVNIEARYSFTYIKRCGRWQIVDHHSSAMPATGFPPARE